MFLSRFTRNAPRALHTITRKPRVISYSSRLAYSVARMNEDPGQTVSDVIKHDHRELEDYYNRIISSNDPDEQVRYQNQFTWELARHSIAEELVVYPALEKNVNGGMDMADKDRKQHQTAKEQLYRFQKMSPSDEDFIPTIKTLYKDLSEHIKQEEERDLPAIEENLAADESEQLARSFERTKLFVPTHSHPSAPDKPPFETVVGLMTAPVDKLMDLFKKFPKK